MQLSIYIFFIAIEPILVESRGRAQSRVPGDFLDTSVFKGRKIY